MPLCQVRSFMPRCRSGLDNIQGLWKNSQTESQIGPITSSHFRRWMNDATFVSTFFSFSYGRAVSRTHSCANWFISLKNIIDFLFVTNDNKKKQTPSTSGNQWLAPACSALTVSDWWLHDGRRPRPWLREMTTEGPDGGDGVAWSRPFLNDWLTSYHFHSSWLPATDTHN